ncbi:endo alpha-1,4 polygalactosaminidase [Exiguobacterium mexicanum]|uniref:endo alpha-1,4 polygalactosaminidase n=1 Tax=Exiguobacterium mexicanum TaxID=340146 RepID=UPI0037C0948C
MNPLDGVKNYQVYYGHPTAAILKDMQNYDLVIIEPLHYTKAQVEQIKARGTKVLGYISVMEVATWNTGLMSKLQSGDFFTRNGQRVHYSEWDSYLTNIASPHFQGLLLTEIQNQVVAKGIDGVFMDTVGDIDNEHLNNPTVLKQQRDGLVNFLKQARARYGDLAMVQNWGFDTLETSTAPYVDGIMWESFNADTIKSDAWSQNMIKKLQAVDAKHSVKTLTISTRLSADSHKLAKDSGFIHFHEADAYVNWNAGLVTRTQDAAPTPAPVAVARQRNRLRRQRRSQLKRQHRNWLQRQRRNRLQRPRRSQLKRQHRNRLQRQRRNRLQRQRRNRLRRQRRNRLQRQRRSRLRRQQQSQ